MDILLTGSTGFVGKNLKLFLSENNLNLSINDISKADLCSSEEDLVSLFNYRKGKVIIHLAAKAHDISNISRQEEYYKTNFELTKKLFNVFLRSSAKKFIFISSVKAATDHINGDLTEDYTPDPKTHYGKSKLMAEQYIQSQVLPRGKSYYILRPCMIHGPGNKGNLNLLYKLISNRIPYPLATFENRRSFLSVENLCFVIREILEHNNIPTGVYLVADDESLSSNELVRLISKVLGFRPILWKINSGLIESIAKLGDVLKLPLNSERLNKLTENYIVDNSKLKKALGKELPVSARDGIIKTIQSFIHG